MEQVKTEKIKNARIILLCIWLGFALINFGIIMFYYFKHWIEIDNFKAAMTQLNASCAPYLGAMLFFFWGRAKKGDTVKTGLPFWLAIIGAVVWNGAILSFILLLNIEVAIDNIKNIGGLLSWLVAGAIGYYFANNSSS